MVGIDNNDDFIKLWFVSQEVTFMDLALLGIYWDVKLYL